MTTGAWVMLAITWTIVIGFTTYFFRKALRTPLRVDASDMEGPPAGPPRTRRS